MTISICNKNGYLYGIYTYHDELGCKRQKWFATGLKERGNKKEAKRIAEELALKFEMERQNPLQKYERRVKPDAVDKKQAAMPFSAYCKKYVEEQKDRLSPSVYAVYKHYIVVFKEFFDKRKLRLLDVTDKDLKEFYAERRKQGIKNTTLKHYNSILRPALRKAYKEKLIPDNPFEFLEPIGKDRVNISFYDKNEMQKFFEAIKGHPLEVPFALAAYYGFRRSEVLGLRWSAVDFEHKLISINHKILVVEKEVYLSDTLKTKTSNRTLPLIAPVEELLLRHKAKIEENKAFYGNTYDMRYADYVCVMENGKIVYPDHMSKKFQDLLKEKGFRHIRLHDLRHSCASNMLAAGVPMKEIQDWLGHADFGTTANVYSHLDFSAKVKAANTITAAYGGVKSPEKRKDDTSIDTLTKALKEMKELGFDSLEDYLAYKKKQ